MEKCGIPAESVQRQVNKTLKSLKEAGLVSEENCLTTTGREELDHYKVDNAIVLAAGMATRFVPVSYEFPEGLTSANALSDMEINLMRSVFSAGIDEMTVEQKRATIRAVVHQVI